jgi:hypothetical protein
MRWLFPGGTFFFGCAWHYAEKMLPLTQASQEFSYVWSRLYDQGPSFDYNCNVVSVK